MKTTNIRLDNEENGLLISDYDKSVVDGILRKVYLIHNLVNEDIIVKDIENDLLITTKNRFVINTISNLINKYRG